MWPYIPELLATPVPRYTSYPTAAEFTGDVGEAAMADALSTVGDDEAVSLYVHIPFCSEICWYCGCNTGRANRTKRLSAYLDALHREIRTVADRLGGRGRVTRIAFGGGSPNALSPLDFARLVDAVTVAFAAQAPVVSVELDPRGFNERWATVLGAAGVSRVSLGVQTFDPAVQAAIGRIQGSDLIALSVARLRQHGIASINFDLMYGLPGQDEASLLQTIDAAIAMAPERIALFGYAHVPHLLPRQRRIDSANLPDQQRRFSMAAIGHERFVSAGYVPVGFDHFARPGDAIATAAVRGLLGRNFQGFTEDRAGVTIGLGASAISQFADRLVQNDKTVGRYRDRAAAGALTAERGAMRTPDDLRRGAIISDLLCGRPADISGLEAETDERLKPFEQAQLVIRNGPILRVADTGRPYARAVAACFDGYRPASARQFSSAI